MSSQPPPTFDIPRRPAHRPGPRGGVRAENRTARETALCQGALSLFVERGIDVVTVDDIARAAGISKAAFYRYFSAKDEVVRTVFEPVIQAIDPALERGTADLEAAQDEHQLIGAYMVLAAALLEIFDAHRPGVRLFVQERLGPRTAARAPLHDLADRITGHIRRMTRASRHGGLLRDVDIEITVRVVQGAVYELISWLLADHHPEPLPATMAYVDIILRGLRRAPDAAR